MKTKTLVLAAAALTACALTASAQSNVYSLNIVGYVNVEVKPGFNLVANPLDDGNGNNSTNLVPAALPLKSQVLVYDPIGGYTTATKKATGWDANFVITPGHGYFIKNNTNTVTYTNTYVGNVVASVPGSVTNTIQAGFNLVGSPYPIGGSHTNMGTNGFNFADTLPLKSQVLTYDSVGGYTTATKKATGWDLVFNLNVGQGFFIKNNTNISYQWIQQVGP